MGIINGLNEGKPIETVVADAFPVPPPPEAPAAGGAGQPDAASSGVPGEVPPGGGAPQGMNASGLMQGVAPGQAGQAAGGRPDLQMLMSQIGANGQAQMTAGVSRRQAI